MLIVPSAAIKLFERGAAAIFAALQNRRMSWAWFGGANLAVLDKAPSDRGFFEILGIVVFALACASGFAVCIAVGYMLDTSPTHLWLLGVAWSLMLACGLERLVMQVSASRKRLLVPMLVLRLSLSILLAFAFGEPLMLLINQDKIGNLMSADRKAALIQVHADADATFDPQVKAVKAEVSRLRRNEAKVKSNMSHYRAISACGSALCEHYAQRAKQRRSDLFALKRRHGGRIAGLKSKIHQLRVQKRAQIADRTKAIVDDNGLIAREEALATLMKDNPHVKYNVWFFRLLFLVIDLLPFSAKVLHVFSGPAYDAAVAAARRTDMVKAEQEETDAEVESQRIKDQAAADIGVNKRLIRAEADRRLRATWGTATKWPLSGVSAGGEPPAGDGAATDAPGPWQTKLFS
jgi:hypothetical protein